MFSEREVVRKLLESLATQMIMTDGNKFAKQHFYKKLSNVVDGVRVEMEITKTKVNIKKDGQTEEFRLFMIDEILDCFFGEDIDFKKEDSEIERILKQMKLQRKLLRDGISLEDVLQLGGVME